MRAFIALPLKKEPLVDIQRKIRIGRLVDNFHITLFFLGDTDAKTLKRIDEAISSSLITPMIVRADKLITLPKKHPRVIAVKYDSEDIINNHKKLFPGIRRIIDLRSKGILPHVTISRIRHLDGILPKIERYEERIDKIILYQSILTKEGAIYKVIKEYLLT